MSDTTTLQAQEGATFSETCLGTKKGKLAKSAHVNTALQTLLNNTANLPIERTKAVGKVDGRYMIVVEGGAVSLVPFSPAVEGFQGTLYHSSAPTWSDTSAAEPFIGGTVSTLNL